MVRWESRNAIYRHACTVIRMIHVCTVIWMQTSYRNICCYIRILKAHFTTIWPMSGHRKPRTLITALASATVLKVAMQNMFVPYPADSRTSTFHGIGCPIEAKCCITSGSVIQSGALPSHS